MSDQAVPGWYPDPSGAHRVRYFDGAAWTEMVADTGLDPTPGDAESLTAKDEAQLARIIGEGRRAADRLADFSNLSASRKMALERTVRKANEAQQRLIASHRHIVVPIVKAYTDRGMDLDHLIEEGKVALRRAAQVFDRYRQTRFAPYAAMKIHEAMVTTLRERDRSEESSAGVPEQTESLGEYIAAAEAAERLTADDEIRLARVIEEGKRAQDALGRTRFSMKSRMTSLKQSASWANSTRRLFVDRNRYLVIPIAREYTDRGMELMDLIEEGNHGLRRAVERLDTSEEQRFATHAEPFIRRAIVKDLERGDNDFTIR